MENSNLVVGAGVGVLAGTGIGLAVGAKKADKVLGAVKNLTKDEYVNTRINANMDNIHSLKQSKWSETFKKVADKAGKDFSEITKKAKSTKNKWIAGLAAAGLAIGAGVAFAASKVNGNKEKESSSQTASYVYAKE